MDAWFWKKIELDTGFQKTLDDGRPSSRLTHTVHGLETGGQTNVSHRSIISPLVLDLWTENLSFCESSISDFVEFLLLFVLAAFSSFFFVFPWFIRPTDCGVFAKKMATTISFLIIHVQCACPSSSMLLFFFYLERFFAVWFVNFLAYNQVLSAEWNHFSVFKALCND